MEKMSTKISEGINSGLSNAQYHAEKEHLSSSNLKLLLDSPARFYKEKILGEKEVKSSPAMELGTYVHSLILEPDQIAHEFATYTGWRKQGPEFEAFKEQHKGKLIISKPQAEVGKRLALSTTANPAATNLLSGGIAELSLATSMFDVPVKMRADYINADKGYIVDIKTTRYPSNIDTFRRVVRELGYELSAALYCDIAYRIYGKVFDFYWVVISKSDIETAVYKASTHTLSEGSALVTKALITYKKCLQANVWPDNINSLPKNADESYEILEI